MDTDKQYLQVDDGTNRDDGCTAVTAVLVKQHLVVANVGDSRAVLSRRGKGTCFVIIFLDLPVAEQGRSILTF